MIERDHGRKLLKSCIVVLTNEVCAPDSAASIANEFTMAWMALPVPAWTSPIAFGRDRVGAASNPDKSAAVLISRPIGPVCNQLQNASG
jgi:hypothetical protein